MDLPLSGWRQDALGDEHAPIHLAIFSSPSSSEAAIGPKDPPSGDQALRSPWVPDSVTGGEEHQKEFCIFGILKAYRNPLYPNYISVPKQMPCVVCLLLTGWLIFHQTIIWDSHSRQKFFSRHINIFWILIVLATVLPDRG